MKVHELASAMAKMVEQGHDEAEVCHVNDTGKATVICGWQLVTDAGWDSQKGIHEPHEGSQLRLFTTSPF
jgi:hypothetical protein